MKKQWVTEVVAVIPTAPNPTPIDYETRQRQRMRQRARRREWLANLGGYFWTPCPICGMEFGGYEWDGDNSSIPAEPDNPNCHTGHAICPACTAENRGWDVRGYIITREVKR